MFQTSAAFRHEQKDLNQSISLSEIISALSYALDLTEGAVHGHALRSCLLGMRIAEEAKLPSDQTGSLYFALLLKDIGCGSSAVRPDQIARGKNRAANSGYKLEHWTKPYKSSLSNLKLLWNNVLPDANPAERGKTAPAQSQSRQKLDLQCDRGGSILNKLGMGEMASEAVRSLEERWDGSGYPGGMRGEQIPLLARICAIAQHLDVFSVERDVHIATDMLQERSGTWFDPQLVRVVLSLHRRGALWDNCSPFDAEDATRQAVLDLDSGNRHHLEPGQVDQICEAFADVVDTKSHFTFRHSQGVAEAAFRIAQAMNLPADRVQMVRRAALLHDIGKLGVSNSILDKRGELTSDEWKAVYRHPRITRLILERVAPFREMAVIAGEHHEKLDGTGYPDHLSAGDLSIESRIIAVADVYGALSEDRPYRPAISLDETLSIMSKLVPYQLDGDCFKALISTISPTRGVSLTLSHAGPSSQVYAF